MMRVGKVHRGEPRPLRIAGFLLFGAALLQGTANLTAGQGKAHPQLPDAPGRDTVERICSACHGVEIIEVHGMTRPEWGEVVANMVSKGAKGTDEELAQVVSYLATNFPSNKSPAQATSAGPQPLRTPAAPKRIMGMGADDKQVVDDASATRGATLYKAECVTCHGPEARGTETGPDLVRSVLVLHDRYGSTLAPFLAKGHPMESGAQSSSLSQAQVEDLSNFLHQQVDNTLRSGPYTKVLNVLTGNAQAGEAYFSGAGQCSSCHSTTGDLAHIASKYDPATLQQRIVFPQTVSFESSGTPPKVEPVTVTVTTPSGAAVSGRLLNLDDFSVSLREPDGEYHTWKRGPDVKVVKHDPYAAHVALLDEYSDKNIHDLVAYLETLK